MFSSRIIAAPSRVTRLFSLVTGEDTARLHNSSFLSNSTSRNPPSLEPTSSQARTVLPEHHLTRSLKLKADIYNLAPCPDVSLLTMSLNSLRRILPLGLLGTASRYTTPPRNCLCWARFFRTNSLICSGDILARSATTYARGNSLPDPSGSETPMTAASRMSSWLNNSASSSAGATCRPLYFYFHSMVFSLSRWRCSGGSHGGLLTINSCEAHVSSCLSLIINLLVRR